MLLAWLVAEIFLFWHKLFLAFIKVFQANIYLV